MISGKKKTMIQRSKVIRHNRLACPWRNDVSTASDRGKKSSFIITLLLALSLFLLPGSVQAAIERVAISQVLQDGREAALYVNAFSEDGSSTEDALAQGSFRVSLDKEASLDPIYTERFHDTEEGIYYTFCVDVSESVTEAEMQEIRAGIHTVINDMRPQDYARIISMGDEIRILCDASQNKEELLETVSNLAAKAGKTFLYKGLDQALEGYRKKTDGMPGRGCIVAFTDGLDDSDGAYTEDHVLSQIAQVRIPLYIVGLKGIGLAENLTSVSTLARQSGGMVFSYHDQGVLDSMQTLQSVMENTYKLVVNPPEEAFGKANITWRTAFAGEGYSVQSQNYIYSLSMDGLAAPLREEEAVSLAQDEGAKEEAEPAPEPEEEKPSAEEAQGPKTGEEDPLEAAKSEEEKREDSVFVRAKEYVRKEGGLLLAAVLVIAAAAIALAALRKDRKNQVKTPPEGQTGSGTAPWITLEPPTGAGLPDQDKTIMDIGSDLPDHDRTVAEYGSPEQGLTLTIAFEGKTAVITRKIGNRLTLGRGESCDVDVILDPSSDARKLTSRVHASILNRADGLYVADEKSRNKTFVNGVEITSELPLKDGDMIQLGLAYVKVKIG